MSKSIVVIGAGLAGTLISNELAKNNNVTLLEIGEKDTIGYPEVKYLRKQLAAVKTFCLGGGGTTNLWHNGLIPILPKDVTARTFREVVVESEAFYDKAAQNLYWPDTSYLSEYEKAISETTEIIKTLTAFPDGIDCLLYPKKFSKVKIEKTVDAYYSVSDLEFIATSGEITTVNYSVAGTTRSLHADIVIISAGTLNSPLLVKKVLASLGCPTTHIGRGLADHPLGFIGKVKVKAAVNNRIKLLSVRDQGKYEYRTAIRLKSECGKYTGCAFLRPAMTMTNDLAIYKFKSLLGASSGTDRIKNMFSWKLFHPDILAEIYSHLFKVTSPAESITFFASLNRKEVPVS